jgi:hypothetical protein
MLTHRDAFSREKAWGNGAAQRFIEPAFSL